MNEIWLYSIGSAVLVSVLALIGILTICIHKKHIEKVILLLVSFSAGALIGDAFIHILPEAVEEYGFTLELSLTVIAGMMAFFILEKFIHWHHCHQPEDKHHKAFVITNLFGDGLHNFVDGLFIASSYMVSIELGIATTVAVALHEIPQELGDFGVLLHGGMKRWKAIKLNLFFALFAVGGAVLGLLIGSANESFLKFILPFTAGGFIYIANTDLFPELHKNSEKTKESFFHLVMILAGVAAMAGLLYLEV
jgi:zinc and cadmium transporter